MLFRVFSFCLLLIATLHGGLVDAIAATDKPEEVSDLIRTVGRVRTVLEGMGASIISEKASSTTEGIVHVSYTLGDGRFVASVLCTLERKCFGIILNAAVAAPDGRAFNDAIANKSNSETPFVQYSVLEEGRTMLLRHFLLTLGADNDNIKLNVRLFAVGLAEFQASGEAAKIADSKRDATLTFKEASLARLKVVPISEPDELLHDKKLVPLAVFGGDW